MQTNEADSKELSAAAETDPPESIAKASLTEIFGAVTLATPTWTIIRHPLRFTRYADNPGAAVHYLYAAIGICALAIKWTRLPGDEANDGGDAAPVVALFNRMIGALGPGARIDGDDAIPIMLLLFNIVSGVTAHLTCRWLAGRTGAASLPPARTSTATQTLAATAYIGGASVVIFAVGTLLARGDANAFPSMAGATLVMFLIYCWGTWIRRIHGLALGRLAGAAFPFALTFLSLAICAGLTVVVDVVLTGTLPR